MKTPFTRPLAAGIATLALLPAALLAQPTTGFLQNGAGPWDYDDTANWVGGTINGVWDSALTLGANQIVSFDSDLGLGTGLTFGYTGARDLTLRGDGTDRTITLGGDITVAPVSNQTVTLGSTTAGQNLNVNLGGNRTFNVSTGKTLRLHNALSGGNLTLNGNNSATTAGGSVILSGDTAAAASNSISVTNGASLSVDSTASGSTGTTRAQSLQLAGGSLSMTGNAGASSTETIGGALTIAPGRGHNGITLTPGAGTHLQLNADTLVRSGTGAVLFRGTGLGVNSIASATADSSNIAFTTAPTAQLVGGALGGKTAAILPWAVVDTSATGLGSSFATYDATNGIRALNASEFSTTIATDGSTDGHNIKLTSTGTGLTVTGATTVNSLFIDHNTQGAYAALTGTGSLTVTSGAVFFNIASMTGTNGATLDIAKNLNFGTTQGIIGTSSSANQRRVSFSGGISGSGGIVFYDTGLNTNQATGFYLNHANTYTGDTYINGTVSVAVNNALANFTNSSRTGDVYLNGVLKLISKDATVQINGLWGNGIVYSQYSNANKTLAVGDNNATSTFGGRIVVDGGTGSINLKKIGTGTLTLTGTDSTYSGITAVQNGTLSAVTLNSVNGGTPLLASSSLGRPTSEANGTIALGNSTTTGNLRITGTGETTDRVINLAGTTGGGGIEQAGTGHLKFTSDFTATGSGSKTLTLSGSTAGTGEIAGAIVDNNTSLSRRTSVTKSGTGTWTLSGVNTYTGATTIDAGTLALGINNAINAGSAIDLNTGGTLDLKSFSTSAASLDFAAGSTLKFNLGTSGNVSALLALTGALAKTGSGVFTLDFSGSGEVGTYNLASFASTAFTNANEFTIANLGGGLTGLLTLGANSLSLTVSAVPEPSTFALLAGAGALLLVVGRRNRRSA
jgi:autotransporter-associated beta strand protein